jgi:hypothetical protein
MQLYLTFGRDMESYPIAVFKFPVCYVQNYRIAALPAFRLFIVQTEGVRGHGSG